jgi:hypothetical protein
MDFERERTGHEKSIPAYYGRSQKTIFTREIMNNGQKTLHEMIDMYIFAVERCWELSQYSLKVSIHLFCNFAIFLFAGVDS